MKAAIGSEGVLVRAAALALATLLASGCSRRTASGNPEVITPVIALRNLTGSGKGQLHTDSLYWNAPALPWLLQESPKRVREEDRTGDSPQMRAFAQAAQDPQLFRKLDRELRFDALWLLGDPSTFKPLLEHLLATKDFTLTWLDHTSLIFHRGKLLDQWQPALLDGERVRFVSKSDQAMFLAGAATKLLAIHHPDEAKRRLEEADRLDSRVREVAAAWASLHLAGGNFTEARKAADRALAIAPEFLPALASKTQALYAMKDVNGAWELSQKLLAHAPADPGLLFYHAKLAHEAHAFTDEIRTMQKLIAIGESAGASVSGYRVYLGQAFAAAGDAGNALDQLTRALLDPELPREQRTFADQLFLQIKDRAGLLVAPADQR